MNTVEIEYPVLFFTRRVKGHSPASWAELTPKQFIAISRVMEGAEINDCLLSVLTSLPARVLRMLSPFQLMQLSREINLFSDPDSFPGIFLIPRLRGTRLYAPNPRLEGMTFGQFIFADAYYSGWLSKKDTVSLNKFIASLYQYRGEKFSQKTLVSKVREISKTNLADRLSIAFNYSLIIHWLQRAYPLVFANSQPSKRQPVIAVSQPTEKQPVPEQSQRACLKLFESLVGDDLIHRDQYARLPIHTVLTYITQKYKDHARTG